MGCTLANTSMIERSVRGGDAALCQITLATRFSSGRSVLSLDLCKSVHMLCTSHRSLAVQRRRVGIMHLASQACTAALPRRVKWLVQALAVCLLTASVAYSFRSRRKSVFRHFTPASNSASSTDSDLQWSELDRRHSVERIPPSQCRYLPLNLAV